MRDTRPRKGSIRQNTAQLTLPRDDVGHDGRVSSRRALPTWQGVVRVGLIATILVSSIAAAWMLRATFEHASVTPNIVLIGVELEGPDARVEYVAFSRDESGGTSLRLAASGTSSLGASIFGPRSGDPGGLEAIKTGADLPPCQASVGTCKTLTQLDGNEPIFLLQAEYAARGAQEGEDPNFFVIDVDIPAWRGTGYVVGESAAYLQVALPAISVSGTDLKNGRVQLSAETPEHAMLTVANWSSDPQPTARLPGDFIWTVDITDGIVPRLGASATVPDELSRAEQSTFLTGVLVGVAAAAALALVGEIRRPVRVGGSTAASGGQSNSTAPTTSATLVAASATSAVARPRPRSFHAARLRRPTRSAARRRPGGQSGDSIASAAISAQPARQGGLVARVTTALRGFWTR